MTLELLYFANPMCSWCWGFAPVMRHVQERWPEMRLVVATGELGRNRDRPMSEADKATVREHWQHVVERTGQPFDFAFFERQGFVYDTEPPSRLLTLLRHHYPATLPAALHRLHERFYARNEAITDRALLAETATEFGLDRTTFDAAFDSEDLIEETAREWQTTARLGVTGYPTLLALQDGKAQVITVGYRPAADVEATIEGLKAAA